MSLTISNNGAVSTASMNLGKNQAKLQQSIQRSVFWQEVCRRCWRWSSGKLVRCHASQCINQPLMRGAQSNVGNAISFLEYQDGVLETAANIVGPA